MCYCWFLFWYVGVGAGERVGAVHVLCADKDSALAVLSSFECIVRPQYSNPPVHGARIVTKVLTDPALAAEWCVTA